MLGQAFSLIFIFGDKELESIHRHTHSGCGVYARSDRKTDIILDDVLLFDTDLFEKFYQSLARSFSQNRQTIICKDSVFARQRDHIRECGHADQVEKPFFMAFLETEPFLFQDRLNELPAHTGAAEIFIRICATGLLWIDDGKSGRQFCWRCVMVSDDDIYPIFIGKLDWTDIGDTTVESDEEFYAVVGDLLDRFVI